MRHARPSHTKRQRQFAPHHQVASPLEGASARWESVRRLCRNGGSSQYCCVCGQTPLQKTARRREAYALALPICTALPPHSGAGGGDPSVPEGCQGLVRQAEEASGPASLLSPCQRYSGRTSEGCRRRFSEQRRASNGGGDVDRSPSKRDAISTPPLSHPSDGGAGRSE